MVAQRICDAGDVASRGAVVEERDGRVVLELPAANVAIVVAVCRLADAVR